MLPPRLMATQRADLYVQVWRSRLHVENLWTGERFALEEGFGHPRLLIGDFLAAERAMKKATARVLADDERPRRLLMHVQEALAGGVSEVEVRALREAALCTGAREIWIFREPRKLTARDAQALLDGSAEPALLAGRSA